MDNGSYQVYKIDQTKGGIKMIVDRNTTFNSE